MSILDTINELTSKVDNLLNERDRLLNAIKKHHQQKADDRCWLDDIDLYVAAGLVQPDIRVGDKEEMLANCKRFIETRCTGGHWTSYVELEAERDRLLSQLPAGMKHCTIVFKECPKGHGWLTATNWAQHPCPTCEKQRLEDYIAKLKDDIFLLTGK